MHEEIMFEMQPVHERENQRVHNNLTDDWPKFVRFKVQKRKEKYDERRK